MIYEKVYDLILEQSSEEEALEFANGFVWSESETSEQEIGFSNHIDTVNDIGIHYDFGADYYFFTDETGE